MFLVYGIYGLGKPLLFRILLKEREGSILLQQQFSESDADVERLRLRREVWYGVKDRSQDLHPYFVVAGVQMLTALLSPYAISADASQPSELYSHMYCTGELAVIPEPSKSLPGEFQQNTLRPGSGAMFGC